MPPVTRTDATQAPHWLMHRLARYVYAMLTRGEAYLQRSLADLEKNNGVAVRLVFGYSDPASI